MFCLPIWYLHVVVYLVRLGFDEVVLVVVQGSLGQERAAAGCIVHRREIWK